MTVHVFPTGREIADGRHAGCGALQTRANRVELWLTAGLIVATAVQAALFVWFWLG